jgi:hypothetical protein
MPVSVSQLIVSADTAGDTLQRIRATKDLTQADTMACAEGSIGVDQIPLVGRGKRPMAPKHCVAVAQALCLTGAQAAQRMPLALINRAPEAHTAPVRALAHAVTRRGLPHGIPRGSDGGVHHDPGDGGGGESQGGGTPRNT